MELASGEFFFRCALLKGPLFVLDNSLTTFKTFLDGEGIDNTIIREKMKSLDSLRSSSKRYYSGRLQNIRESRNIVDSRRNELLSKVHFEVIHCLKHMRSFVDVQDHALLQLVLSYFSVLKYELLENRKLVDMNYSLYKQKIKSLQIVKDLKLYAHHINVETKGNYELL